MKIYWYNERKNIVGINLKEIRTKKKLTQNDIAVRMQLKGLDFDRITVSRIENGLRFVPDYEVKFLCEALEVTFNELLA
ncbi:MAG: helix-turn-helix transcriptional regulator [Clostridia bacterium]|nr:helix-turn-helix transcriptional regulator [Clostridia bacterium]